MEYTNKKRGDNLANKGSPPLTEREILSVYRNEFYKVDDPQYFGNSILKPRYYDEQGFNPKLNSESYVISQHKRLLKENIHGMR